MSTSQLHVFGMFHEVTTMSPFRSVTFPSGSCWLGGFPANGRLTVPRMLEEVPCLSLTLLRPSVNDLF